ncbi:MAG: hypothetical protein CHACPFDD_04067 [Phycisphaerae bacterium]|nr:hypothetical protein [Phycisphaerae bacterium]
MTGGATGDVYIMLLAIGVAGLLGLVIVASRRRSTAVRVCPRCGYDLRGTPTLRCSECGYEALDERELQQSLAWPRAARVGRRCLVLLFVLLAIAVARRVDWYSMQPTSWLVRDLSGQRQSVVDRAAIVLQKRVAAHRLRHGAVQGLIGVLESIHGRPSRVVNWPHKPASRLYSELFAQGLLNRAAQQKFASTLAKVTLTTRDVVQAGRPTPVRVFIDNRCVLPAHMTAEIGLDRLGGPGPPYVDGVWSNLQITDGYSTYSGFSIANIEPGHHAIELSALTTIREASGEVLLTHEQRLCIDLECTSDDVTSRVALVAAPDPELARRIASGVRVERARFVRCAPPPADGREWTVSLSVTYPQLIGMDMAFDVYVSVAAGADEVHVGRVLMPQAPPASNVAYLDSDDQRGAPQCMFREVPRSLTLRLVPSRRAAYEQSPDINAIWDGELAIPDVPVNEVFDERGEALTPAPPE